MVDFTLVANDRSVYTRVPYHISAPSFLDPILFFMFRRI